MSDKTNDFKLKNTIHKMLIENTGRHFLDSGGAYGRLWEKNQGKTLGDFQNEAPAYLDISSGVYNGVKSYDFSVGVSLYHKLVACLELDQYCIEFNSLAVDNWQNDQFYGVSDSGGEWLENKGFTESREWFTGGFNSYNFNSNLSQDIQGHILDSENGDKYVLLQIHGGCDIRGGYTDAKLFKFVDYCEPYNLFESFCFFDVGGMALDYRDNDGFTGSEGAYINTEKLNEMGARIGDCLINGFFNTDY